MAVNEGSWSQQARRRGRTIAIRLIVGGCALAVVLVGLLLANGTPRGLRPLLILALLVPLHLIMHGRRRLKIESSPTLKPPLVLPAVSDPGSFARLPDPRPAFGLHLHFRPLRGAMYLGVIFGLPMIVLAATSGAVAALLYGLLWLGIEGWNLNWFLRSIPLEVRVTNTLIEWRSRLRNDVIPIESLRRLRCNTLPSTAIVLEFENHRPRLLLVTGGFADFLEVLTVACSWVEVSSEIVDRFGSWTGKTNGFFVESPDPATRGD